MSANIFPMYREASITALADGLQSGVLLHAYNGVSESASTLPKSVAFAADEI